MEIQAETITLRSAEAGDAKMLFDWRNDPEIVVLGASGAKVKWDAHRAWFERSVGSPDALLFIAMAKGVPAGQIRFDRHDGDLATISIYLLEPFRGRGMGREVLARACQKAFRLLKVTRIRADVLSANSRSASFFEKSGFCRRPGGTSHDALLVFELAKPGPVPHNRLSFGEEEVASVVAVVRSGYWAQGPQVAELERKLAGIAGFSHAVCVSSGSAALRLALMAIGVSEGDAVLVPAYCCVAVPNSVLALGAKPVPCEVSPHDFNISKDAAARSLRSSSIKAIIAVNTFGSFAPASFDGRVPVIEDGSHGLPFFFSGGRRNGGPAMAVMSLYATKLIAAGEGGAIFTESKERADFLRGWRDYADGPPHRLRLNDKMSDVEAGIALAQVGRLMAALEQRARIAEEYGRALSPIAAATGAISLPPQTSDRIWYRYAVRVKAEICEAVIARVREYGVWLERPVSQWHYSPAGELPGAEECYRSVVSLPLYPSLTRAEQRLVVSSVIGAIEESL